MAVIETLLKTLPISFFDYQRGIEKCECKVGQSAHSIGPGMIVGQFGPTDLIY